VSAVSFESSMFLAILPEILILILAGFVLALDAVWTEDHRRNLGWVTFGGLFAIFVACLVFARPAETGIYAFGSMVRYDWLAFIFKMLFIFAAAITALFVMDSISLGKRGEFYFLMLVSIIGMNLMASAGDVIMLYLAIETTSIPLYILAGFLRQDDKSAESGFKYLLFGAMTSTIMLYGLSLLYGMTGQTSFTGIAGVLSAMSTNNLIPVIGSMLIVLVGFGFKISAVPFHFWAPDVYEGAPTPVAGFLSTASKSAGFAVLFRFLMLVFPDISEIWTSLLAILSVATMTVGNLLALAQHNIKRLLAYSSIAHAGYILIGVVALGELGFSSVVFYLGAYLVTNLAAFGAVVIFSNVVGSDEISDYAGLSRRSPGLAFAMLVSFLSLAGMPPLAGFVAKVFVFAAAVNSNWIWLAVVGVLNSIIGLYYYLTVLKVIYLYPLKNPDEEHEPLAMPRSFSIAMTVLTFGIILIGVSFGPFFNWASGAVLSMTP
jgi:NADH-quinone oxidoreductase subunit N